MYTVLLTDDEISVTNSLKSSIPWTSLGIEEIYTAVDGIQALELFSSHRIDLLITDIKMPRMDGLDLLKHVRANYPDTHCILLTAYGTFEYARSALRLGVENYLLKPIQIKEITETIENAIDNVYARRENIEMLFQENILRRWLSGNISGEELWERANILDINLYQSAYCVIAIRKTIKSVSLLPFSEECIKEFKLNLNLDSSSVWDNHGRYLLIIGGKTISLQTLCDTFEKIANRMNMLDKINISIGSVVTSSDDLPLSYQSASLLSDQDSESTLFSIRVSPIDTLTKRIMIPDIKYKNLSPIIKKAIDHIHNDYSEGVSIKEFCAKYTMTTAYIGYLFKKETNIFFNDYLNSYRISKAIDMLTSTSYKINDIAIKTGFSTTSYFITAFKKYTGTSPQKYRELHT